MTIGQLLEPPAGPLATAVFDLARRTETVPVLNHSMRSYCFAAVLAEHEGVTGEADYDPLLLFAATVLHDVGTGSEAPGRQRFEVEGADLAAELLTAHGTPGRDVDRVWEAIAVHTSAGIAERRGVLAYLTREGVGIDFGRRAEIVAASEAEIHRRWPRLHMARSLVDEIVKHAARSPAAAPLYSLPGELLRERRESGTSRLEIGAASSVWGD